MGGVVAAGTGTRNARAQSTRTIEMNDALQFVPSEVTVPPGTRVVWETVGSIGHSVTAYEERIPAEATYFASGGFEAESPARSGYPTGDVGSGETFEHTFEVEGTYEYFCVPHETAGMLGTIVVGEGGGTPAGDDGGSSVPVLPDSARTLALATLTAMASVLGLGYFFMKYGGDYVDTE
jgi:plastocyanin